MSDNLGLSGPQLAALLEAEKPDGFVAYGSGESRTAYSLEDRCFLRRDSMTNWAGKIVWHITEAGKIALNKARGESK